ncbi:MAG: restriction system-associated AAA family ATPase [Bacteroidetes bacterium]|nr:restriction system-associated AAA family ATPase [Bacteroidota bacterium]
MKLVELELYSPFRGLQEGFKIFFTRPLKDSNKIEPICFVGLNGSGKSNVMQVLAEIFFYLESYSIPDIKQYTKAETWFGFRIHYKLPVTPRNILKEDSSEAISSLTWRDVIVTKENGRPPVFEYFYTNSDAKHIAQGAAMFAKLLPNQIIGYSSGMNEMVSVPFTKMDFYYFDELKKKESLRNEENSEEEPDVETIDKDNIPEPDIYRLFFLNYQNNSLAVLANYLFREYGEKNKKREMDVVNELLQITDLHSFRIGFNFKIKNNLSTPQILQKVTTAGLDAQSNSPYSFNDFVKTLEIPYRLKQTLEKIGECSTTQKVLTDRDIHALSKTDDTVRIELYFKVDKSLKSAFRDKFPGGAIKFFGELYLLNLLNIENFDEATQFQVKQNNLETNIHEFLPKVADEEKVFHVDAIRLKKANRRIVYYKQLSDGEHQYLQVTGSLLLIDENASLFLLDEPETHFNPEWRRKLISSLNEILSIKIKNDPGLFIPQQEVILTTHSPFVVSDCQKENVYIFYRDENDEVRFRKPTTNTYGTSANILLKELFDKDFTIAETPNKRIEDLEVLVEQAQKVSDLEEIKREATEFGDSVEKFMLFYMINSKLKSLNDMN